jgi:uncharacterized protein YqeY
MSELFSRIQNDLNASRKAQDKARTLVLGTALSELKNREIELRRDLTNEDVTEVLQKSIKKRRESIELFTKANREDLAAKERAEVETLDAYLPAQATDDDLRSAVRAAIAAGANNVGGVMGKVLPQFKGRAEGSRVSAIAREELGKAG